MSIVLTASVFVIAIVSILMLIALIIFVVGIYNSLISLKINIDRATSNIDVLAKQRFDEIPNLVKVCNEYMSYEKEALQKIIEARNIFLKASDSHETVNADLGLESALKSLYAVAESYPELKANEQFLNLQKRITALENNIAARREFYNASVALYNARIYQIPDIIIARFLNLKEKPMFRTENTEELKPVKAEIKY
ncbi:MAG: LemA family protein [Endomicrobia bacterium]|nr:LemA family protein [Endomicrobiia bacterium]MCL2798732.1 LemA family protein [Endomicrobiia bacterium]